MFVSSDVFQYMESVAAVYLECREQTLDVEQLVAMTCKTNFIFNRNVLNDMYNKSFFAYRYVSEIVFSRGTETGDY